MAVILHLRTERTEGTEGTGCTPGTTHTNTATSGVEDDDGGSYKDIHMIFGINFKKLNNFNFSKSRDCLLDTHL